MRPTTLGLVRTAYVVLGALVAPTVLTRLGVPAAWLPDLVLIGVVATAALRGWLHGAIVGLLAGWVVELVPPVNQPMGLTALVMMAAGAVAGGFRRDSSRSTLRAPLALLVAAGVVVAGRLAVVVLAEGGVPVTDGLRMLASTLGVGLLILPAFLALDRALVRRRLG